MLLGCDFSSSPSRRKSIVLAWGRRSGAVVVLDAIERLSSLDAFEVAMQRTRPWLGAFDLPFGLPRALVRELGWPQTWEACVRHYASLEREAIRELFVQFCNARPVGSKFAHRACDGPAGSSPSMKWVNPPVAYMLHAGVVRMLNAGVQFPGLQHTPAAYGPDARIALEGYPGLLAREVLERRSYKSDDRTKQTQERFIARKDLVTALEMGQTRLALRLKLTHAQHDTLVDDASGDALDAVLCMLQAAWADAQHAGGDERYGLPVAMDPLEGWIITATVVPPKDPSTLLKQC